MAGHDRSRILKIAELLTRAVDKMAPMDSDGSAYHSDESPEHLYWMVNTVQETGNMPDDKAGRWLGCVYGLVAARDVVPSAVEQEIWKLLSQSRVILNPALSFAYIRIVPELSARLATLRNRTDVPTSLLNLMQFDIDWIAGEYPGEEQPSVLWASFQIGYIQGYLKAFREIDFKQERDRTRPIMHKAYETMGIAAPATVERRA